VHFCTQKDHLSITNKDQAFASSGFLVFLAGPEAFFFLLVPSLFWSVEVVPLRFPIAHLPVFVAVDGGIGLAVGKFDMMKLESGRPIGSTLLAAFCEA